MDGFSKDLTADKLEKLKQLLPEIFTENTIDFNKFKTVMGENINSNSERYGLNWAGKSEAFNILQQRTSKTLIPAPDESIDFENTNNIFIEGENLDVLKVLQNSYHGKIKMIYIDPPYNTGNDFIYNDNFRQTKKAYQSQIDELDEDGNLESYDALKKNSKDNAHYHSNWLSMMMPRLYLAKNLLTDDGVIFISIDDNEVHNLRMLCDEIFGEENFIAILSVENNPKGRKNSEFVSTTHEYCVIYAKIIKNAQFKKNIPKHSSDMVEDENGDFIRKSGKRVLMGENALNEFVTNFTSLKHYSVYMNGSDLIFRQEKYIDEYDPDLLANGYRRYITFYDGKFVENTYTKTKFQELFESHALDIRENKIYEKHFSNMMQIKSMLVNNEYKAIINNQEIFYKIDLKTTSAKQDLTKLMQCEIFSFPKNISFIRHLIDLQLSSNDIILDFFAGSGTTAHAVMKLNAEDGGKRRYICVQIPEKCSEDSEAFKSGYTTIAEITKERIRRASKQIAEELGDKAKDIDLGCKIFKLADSNFKQWNISTIEELVAEMDNFIDPVVEGATIDNMIYEFMLKNQFQLTTPITKHNDYIIVGSNNPPELVLLLTEISQEIIDKLIKLKPNKIIILDTLFNNDDQLKTNTVLQLKDGNIKFQVV